MKRPDPLLSLCVAAALCQVWSAVGAADHAVWPFEISLGVAGILALMATRRRFPFSALVYLPVGIHFAVLAAGGKYTCEAVPLGNCLRDLPHLSRNPFDRIGHFLQGFVPAIIAREVLLRMTPCAVARGCFVAAIASSARASSSSRPCWRTCRRREAHRRLHDLPAGPAFVAAAQPHRPGGGLYLHQGPRLDGGL